jgi:hypothetical protein
VLVGATAGTGTVTAWSASRGWRATVEAFGLVSLGLLALDLAGGWSAGWYGDLGGPAFAVVAGLALAAAAGGSVLAVRRTPALRFAAGEVVAAVGGAVAAGGLAAGGWSVLEVRLLAGVLLTSALALTASRLRLPVATVGGALVAVGTWSALVVAGLDRIGAAPTLRSVWAEGDGWPLLAAAAVAVLPGLWGRADQVPPPVRVGCLGAGLLLLAVLVVAPVLDEAASTRLAVVLGITAAAAVATLAARPWGTASAVPLAAGLLWSTAATAQLGTLAAARLLGLSADPWAGSPTARLDPVSVPDAPAGWLLPVAALTVLAGLIALARVLAVLPERRLVRRRLLAAPRGAIRALAAAAVAGAVTGTLALYPAPVWALLVAPLTGVVTVSLSTTGLPGAAEGLVRPAGPGSATAVSGAWLTLLGLAAVPALSDAWLTLAAAATATACAAWLALRCLSVPVAVTAAAALPAAAAGLAWTVAALVGLAVPGRALAGLVVVAVLAMLPGLAGLAGLAGQAGLLAAGRDPLPSRTRSLAGLEASGLLVAVLLGGAGAGAAADPLTWLAGYLAVAAAGVAAVPVLRPERRWALWLAGGLLVAASWLWLADRMVTAPEPYTLPSAAALLGVGLLRLRRVPGSGTGTALTPGLALALGPSLAWSLADPQSLRTVLLGIACVGLVMGGARLQWAAPLLAGAAAGGALVVRLAAPYLAVGVPRWLLLAIAGVSLLALGVSWERRLREARAALEHLRALR